MKIKSCLPIILVIGLVLNNGVLLSQNLVVNGSFEKCTLCPTEKKTGFLSNGWRNATKADSDYFRDKCPDNKKQQPHLGVPVNKGGVSEPVDGLAYIGLAITYQPYLWREYVQTKLIQPLQKGQQYAISFYYRLSSNSGYACADLAMAITPKELSGPHTGLLNYKPQIAIDKQYNRDDWNLHNEVYHAKGGERYITLGNFNGDIKSHVDERDVSHLSMEEKKATEDIYQCAYFYIDKVSVIPLDSSSVAENTDKPSQSTKEEYETALLETGKITSNDIKFQSNSYKIKSESFPVLNTIGEILVEKKDIRIKIIGHTDNVGDKSYHAKLSLKRSKSIRDYFISRFKIKKDRLVCKGKGSEEPLESNETEKGRISNRRVEFEQIID